MENKELKVKSFRVNEETFAKFKELASKEFANQAQCLEALINIYETEESKTVLVNRELEIESFQDYLNKINRLFLTSLQLSNDAEERAKETFIKKIEAKDEALSVLKEKIDELKNTNKAISEEMKKIKKDNDNLKLKNSELEEAKNTLAQLSNRNSDLADKYKSDAQKYLLEKNEKEKIEALFNSNTQEIFELNSKVATLTKENSAIMNKIKQCENNLKEKDEEIKSYKMLLESVRRESKAEIIANKDKCKEEYRIALKEREELLERSFLLDKKELELKIKELEFKLK